MKTMMLRAGLHLFCLAACDGLDLAGAESDAGGFLLPLEDRFNYAEPLQKLHIH